MLYFTRFPACKLEDMYCNLNPRHGCGFGPWGFRAAARLRFGNLSKQAPAKSLGSLWEPLGQPSGGLGGPKKPRDKPPGQPRGGPGKLLGGPWAGPAGPRKPWEPQEALRRPWEALGGLECCILRGSQPWRFRV